MFSLGQRIRELRLKQGLTQIDLSKGICTPSMISQIESDRARPSYKILFAIAEKLEVPLEKLLVDVDMNLEYISTYKMARAMVAAQEYASAIPLLKELLETSRAQISTMDLLFDLGVCHLHIGELAEAEKLLTEVQGLAVMRQDHPLLAQVQLNVGLIELFRKHYQLAAYQWQKAIEEADKLEEQDLYLKANVLFNLGAVHVKMGQIHEGLAFYRQASELYDKNDNLYEIGKVYMGLCVSYKKLGDLAQAADYSERALSIFETLEQVLMSLKLKMLRATLYGQTGQFEEAKHLLHEVIAQSRALGKRDEEGTAYVELANVYLLEGQFDEAEETCRTARVLLPELHLYRGFVNRVLGEIALHRGQHEEAVRRFQSAADCFKNMDEIGVWDDTMFKLAKLYLEDGEAMLAYDTLSEMRRYSKQVLEERGIVL